MGVVAQVFGADGIAVLVFSFASIVAGHAFVGFFFPGVVLLHQFLSGGCGFKFAVFFQLIHERRSILQNFFFHQRVHTCIGFDEGRVHGLPFAPDHSFLHTKRKDFPEEFQKKFLTKKLPCTAQRGMPGKFLVQVIPQKEAHIQAVAAIPQ